MEKMEGSRPVKARAFGLCGPVTCGNATQINNVDRRFSFQEPKLVRYQTHRRHARTMKYRRIADTPISAGEEALFSVAGLFSTSLPATKTQVNLSSLTKMARYFFHVRLGDDLALDPEGEDFPDLQAAHEEALRCAREMLAEKVLAGEPIDGQSIEIAGEDGTLVLRVTCKSALRLD